MSLAARAACIAAVCCAVWGTAGCASDDDSSDATAGAGGSGGSSAGSAGGSSASAGAGSSAGGNAGDSSAGTGAGGGAAFSEVGVCGHRAQATVTDSGFSGFEEYFLIGEEGFGDDICIVRFDVERAGDPPGDCPDCEWSHRVRLSTPTIVLDENGVCENSELGFDADRIAEIEGSEPAYGYVDEFAGHVSVLMKYDEDRSLWDAFGSATYDPDTQTLKFERRNGFCNYRP